MTSARKHHFLWAGLTISVVGLIVLTRSVVYYFLIALGPKNERVVYLGVGEGALFVGIPSGIWKGVGVYSGKDESVLDHFCLQPGMIAGIPYIPLWFLILIPLTFWMLAVYRLERSSRLD